MKKGGWKKLLLVLLPIAVFVVFALLDPQIEDIGSVLLKIDPLWLIGAFVCILLYYLLDTTMYLLACKYMQEPQPFKEGLITTMIGFFYSALTPFSSGGQPMQVLQMRKRGIKVGAATSVIMVKFLAWQLAITVLGSVAFFFVGSDADHASMIVLYCIGFCLYFGTVILALLVLFKPDWVHRVGESILGFLARRRILKRSGTLKRARQTWQRTIKDLKTAVKFTLKHKWGMLLIFLVCLLEAVSYMSVTYFIYRGMGNTSASFISIIMMQCFLHIAVSFIPLPGASVASEGGFYLIFSKFFLDGQRFPAMVLWRLVTYYSALVFGAVFVVIEGIRNPRPPEGTVAELPAEEADPPHEGAGI
ncbi:flippase-like domain-containing protein [Christensenellaceae bacterium OttesenSCG-928-M15]|nr:flippase-like domain-containing protein [Christensenellaceae bacterium OttesenSCG-928-M15]